MYIAPNTVPDTWSAYPPSPGSLYLGEHKYWFAKTTIKAEIGNLFLHMRMDYTSLPLK